MAENHPNRWKQSAVDLGSWSVCTPEAGCPGNLTDIPMAEAAIKVGWAAEIPRISSDSNLE
jgi:hypothetical protein